MTQPSSEYPIIGLDARIATALAGVSLCVLFIRFCQGQILRQAPPWLRPFAQEEEPYYKSTRYWSVWTPILIFISFFGFAISLASALVPFWIDREYTPEVAVWALETCPWFVTVWITVVDRPVKTPKLLLLEYLFMGFAALTTYSVHFLHRTDSLDLDAKRMATGALSFLTILIIGNMPLRDPCWPNDDIGNGETYPSHSSRSPEDNLTLFQFWTMTWVYPLAKIAKTRELFVEDVWQLPVEFQHTRLYLAFRELKGKLLPCLIEANGLDLFISTMLAIVEKVSEVSNIRLTSKLYKALDSNNPSDAAFWCAVMLSIDCVRHISKTSCGWYSRKAYERSRGETFIALFGKLLTRAVPGSEAAEKAPETQRSGSKKKLSEEQSPSGSASESASNAKVVNLVRGDTYEISQRFWEFHRVVAQPIKVAFTVYYLIDIMGWTSCIGFGLMFIFLGFNSILVKYLIELERERARHSDRRAQAVAHFVEASKPLKFNGWTSFWSSKIMEFRDLEMKKRLQISKVNSGIATVNVTGGVAYPLASICLYTLILGDGLPNDVIWPSLQLFGHLEASVKEAFDLISAFWKATIPVDRVNKYMSEPDRFEDTFKNRNSRNIAFRNASFSWPSTGKKVLRDISLSFNPGLTIIRGKVGSGKSSLLLAALNELELTDGFLQRPDEPVAYGQQLPWLQSMTIRDNILFHQPFDPSRYREAVQACALMTDFDALPYGDQTRLEEGGIGLSGGQKARVALARAIYSRADILLLDDPLAALDHDTASIIVKKFLGGPLARGRTIVMVTHRDELVLGLADKVINMHEGTASVTQPLTQMERRRRDYYRTLANKVSEQDEAGNETESTDEADEVVVPETKDLPERETEAGGVPVSIYTRYMRAGGWSLWICLAFFYSISRYCDIARARLLEAWGQQSAGISSLSGYWGLPEPESHPKPWLCVLAGLSVIQVLSYWAAQILLTHISINAAQELFKIAIGRVSKATFRYHDITPTGQLKNRLISDMGMVDAGILSPLESFIYNLIALTLSLTAIMSQQPSLLIILVGVSVLYVYFFQSYVPISRSLRRMEMRYLTPIIANIGVLQDGLVTIRALRVERPFQEKHLSAVDDFQKQDHFFWSMAFWLDFRLGMSSAWMRAALIVTMIWYGTPASAVGFVLSQTTVAMGAVQQLCEKFAALQLDAVSLERVEALSRIPEEPSGDRVPPDDWPRPCDSIKFESMTFAYDVGLPSVLDNVSFEIPGGSTCAVLGRTGSGKSTIATALLATQTPICGKVKIGSADLAHVDRTVLRNRITFIQQDPTLFPGTLRDNIDPEGRYSDEACENAIHRVLGEEWRLDSQIDAGGKNLSQGQRQLVGIARAVLRRSGLVILDEATASIDRGTAAQVQRILRQELANSTVITIAHRLEAVEDANWRLRLDHGKVVECGPANV